jgi:DNA mismatch endonuclease, patch repair protein
MSRIRSKNTKPELIVRSLLHRLGYRFTLRRRDLPGRPDIVLPCLRTVVFVHGCFWHRHSGCANAATPRTRAAFWNKKFHSNVARDRRNRNDLKRSGWRTVVVWECEVLSDPSALAHRLAREIGEAHRLRSSIAPPGWNASNPSASFRAFAEAIHRQARQVFVKDGHHAEFMFFMPLDGKGHLVHTRFDNRDMMAVWVKTHVAEHYPFGVLHICEAWLRLAEGKNDNILRQVIDGEMKVSELREEDRKEALTVTAQARDGYSMTWIDEIVRDKKTGKVSLKPTITFKEFEGRFGKLFG